MRVVHFYTMKDEPKRVREIAPEHSAYWKRARVGEYQGGPFEDWSGGLISFEVDSRQHAEQLIQADPFVREELLEFSSIKQWMVDA